MTHEFQYDPYTQRWIASLERLREQRRSDPNSVALKELEETKATVERLKENARAMHARQEQLEAAKQARRDAEAEAAEEQRMKRVEAETAAFKERARANFPGTAAEFERAWSEIKKQWQIERAVGADRESAIARARAKQRELSPDRYTQF